jgi:hypothetical protein
MLLTRTVPRKSEHADSKLLQTTPKDSSLTRVAKCLRSPDWLTSPKDQVGIILPGFERGTCPQLCCGRPRHPSRLPMGPCRRTQRNTEHQRGRGHPLMALSRMMVRGDVSLRRTRRAKRKMRCGSSNKQHYR